MTGGKLTERVDNGKYRLGHLGLLHPVGAPEASCSGHPATLRSCIASICVLHKPSIKSEKPSSGLRMVFYSCTYIPSSGRSIKNDHHHEKKNGMKVFHHNYVLKHGSNIEIKTMHQNFLSKILQKINICKPGRTFSSCLLIRRGAWGHYRIK